MDQKPTPKKNPNKDPGTRQVFLFLLVAVLLIPTLTVCLLVGGLPPREPVTTDPATTPPGVTPSGPALPVFSGGVIPTMPGVTANTATMAEGNSTYAVLVNAATGEILAAKNDDVQFSPASMTKVMTLIVACERLTTEDLERRTVLTQEITSYVTSGAYAGTSVALIDGDKYLNDEFRLIDLLYGIGVASAADCTMMVVSEVCPAASAAESEAAFVALMNQKAAELGLTKTHFDNVAGHDSANNLTTAREMAVIMSYALQSTTITDILAVHRYPFKGYYYKEGILTTYNREYNSTLFKERVESYERNYGKSFVLSTTTLLAGKTGYLSSSYLACAARGKSNGVTYVLILGDAPKSYHTMADVKTILDTYVK